MLRFRGRKFSSLSDHHHTATIFTGKLALTLKNPTVYSKDTTEAMDKVLFQNPSHFFLRVILKIDVTEVILTGWANEVSMEDLTDVRDGG